MTPAPPKRTHVHAGRAHVARNPGARRKHSHTDSSSLAARRKGILRLLLPTGKLQAGHPVGRFETSRRSDQQRTQLPPTPTPCAPARGLAAPGAAPARARALHCSRSRCWPPKCNPARLATLSGREQSASSRTSFVWAAHRSPGHRLLHIRHRLLHIRPTYDQHTNHPGDISDICIRLSPRLWSLSSRALAAVWRGKVRKQDHFDCRPHDSHHTCGIRSSPRPAAAPRLHVYCCRTIKVPHAPHATVAPLRALQLRSYDSTSLAVSWEGVDPARDKHARGRAPLPQRAEMALCLSCRNQWNGRPWLAQLLRD